ncbi:redox-regulated ATPase YchF [Saccharolobus solfataricus]|nr:redox-regulated ATPase YchF [Saccharolobus solfataricus]AKA74066.1 redox-regulated ATPase YchF [Saccharolobus solfataricus]AKA76763.1 redox-regulated ATPase YchF [Saccharolobus solfataricus]AKA79457.1 redox-regulated ATPase YchF [Saccharolobus solfataricus]AZF68545.1 redox-regulated ATPase YchF [Saccharolobus solfataricus]AZF71165.1 redox-regulated ATPase YchF [Saccharolobus solfataricus]
MITIGIIGKTNVGKSTFFAAATLKDVEIANRPFVTINPNEGIGYVKVKCAHTEFNVKCNPKNSICIEDYRFIPVKLVDVAGLIPGAHEGRGLGNKFLDDLRQADALIHVIDASGSTNEEGVPVEPGSRDPEEDIKFIESELDEWFYSIINKDWAKFARTSDLSGKDLVDALLSKLSGVSVNRSHIIETLKVTKLENLKLMQWTEQDLRVFAKTLRSVSKPMIIAANKSDLPQARNNIRRLKEKYKWAIPTSAASEMALRKAAKAGIISYIPGDSDFTILKPLNEKQKSALEYIRTSVLQVYGSTGVQQAINTAIFDALNMIVTYPVEDERKLTDKNGNVLPDAILLKKGSTPKDLANAIHTELAKGFLYAIDVKRKMRVGENYQLQNNDVIKIVSSTARPS